MSEPRCGGLYKPSPSRPGSADLRGFVVLTEDDWNTVMHDSVVVPIYERADAAPSLMQVRVADGLFADCTRVISLAHEVMGDLTTQCPKEPWDRVRIGVRVHLDLDRRLKKGPKPAPASPSSAWWPRQDAVHFAQTATIPARKLYAAVTDDDWNSQPDGTRAAFVRLTSWTKGFRERWEVPVSGGWVVTGDIYQLLYSELAQAVPVDDYPSVLTADEAARIAHTQKTTLSFR